MRLNFKFTVLLNSFFVQRDDEAKEGGDGSRWRKLWTSIVRRTKRRKEGGSGGGSLGTAGAAVAAGKA